MEEERIKGPDQIFLDFRAPKFIDRQTFKFAESSVPIYLDTGWYAEPLIGLDLKGSVLIGLVLIGLVLIRLSTDRIR